MDERDNPYAPPQPQAEASPAESLIEEPPETVGDDDEQPYPKLLLGLLLAVAIVVAILGAIASLQDFFGEAAH